MNFIQNSRLPMRTDLFNFTNLHEKSVENISNYEWSNNNKDKVKIRTYRNKFISLKRKTDLYLEKLIKLEKKKILNKLRNNLMKPPSRNKFIKYIDSKGIERTGEVTDIVKIRHLTTYRTMTKIKNQIDLHLFRINPQGKNNNGLVWWYSKTDEETDRDYYFLKSDNNFVMLRPNEIVIAKLEHIINNIKNTTIKYYLEKYIESKKDKNKKDFNATRPYDDVTIEHSFKMWNIINKYLTDLDTDLDKMKKINDKLQKSIPDLIQDLINELNPEHNYDNKFMEKLFTNIW